MSKTVIKEWAINQRLYITLKSKEEYLNSKLLQQIKVLMLEIDKFLRKKSKNFRPLPKKIQQVELTITLCSNWKIKSLNNIYRSKNKTTDVLSFPIQDSLRNGLLEDDYLSVLELGDIFICQSVAKSQAKKFRITYNDEVLHLLVHGFLHLCGFDHEISLKEEKCMQHLEKYLINRLSAKE